MPKGSPIDLHAAHNCCSVYTGVIVFPLLPEALSTDRTSLVQDAERDAVVIEMDIDTTGAVAAQSIYRARTRNYAQLAYEDVGEWLDNEGPIPARAAATAGIEGQLRLQHELAQRLLDRRHRDGALDFDMVEARPVVEEGRITDLTVPKKNPARWIIENFMIAANTTMAQYLEERGFLPYSASYGHRSDGRASLRSPRAMERLFPKLPTRWRSPAFSPLERPPTQNISAIYPSR